MASAKSKTTMAFPILHDIIFVFFALCKILWLISIFLIELIEKPNQKVTTNKNVKNVCRFKYIMKHVAILRYKNYLFAQFV